MRERIDVAGRRTSVGPAASAEGGGPRGCTNLKLHQFSRLVAHHYEAHVAPTGLQKMQYSLLSAVIKFGPLRPSELGAAMRIAASTVTRNLQPLIAQGWIELGPGQDARSRLVQATDAGRAKRAEGQRAWKKAQLALNARLGSERVTALHALLDDCMAVLDAADDEGGDD
ncbi:MAG: MarR family winged helix-turn-helix transcriptional regulator [Myxococcaceae bacterium]